MIVNTLCKRLGGKKCPGGFYQKDETQNNIFPLFTLIKRPVKSYTNPRSSENSLQWPLNSTARYIRLLPYVVRCAYASNVDRKALKVAELDLIRGKRRTLCPMFHY
jgi:hypothetical protein